MKYRQAFVFFLFIFEQLSKIHIPDICLLAGSKVTIYHSVLGHSDWGDNRINTWGKSVGYSSEFVKKIAHGEFQ